jgi:hypothetical protein
MSDWCPKNARRRTSLFVREWSARRFKFGPPLPFTDQRYFGACRARFVNRTLQFRMWCPGVSSMAGVTLFSRSGERTSEALEG